MALSDINYVQYQKFLEVFTAEYGDESTRPTGFELESMFAGWLLYEKKRPPYGWVPELGEDVLLDTFGVGVVNELIGTPPTHMRVRAKATGILHTVDRLMVKPWRK